MGRFDLLAAFYGEIVIPQAVYQEIVVRGEGHEGSREGRSASGALELGMEQMPSAWPTTARGGRGR